VTIALAAVLWQNSQVEDRALAKGVPGLPHERRRKHEADGLTGCGFRELPAFGELLKVRA
jgi:hypothetical protein